MMTTEEINTDNPPTLFAICKLGNRKTVHRIKLTPELQVQVGRLFERQASDFLPNNAEIIQYEDSGSWNADPDEVFVTDPTPDAPDIFYQVTNNQTAVEILEPAEMSRSGIKALCVPSYTTMTTRVLVQSFSSRQLLQRRGLFAMVLQGDTFNRLASPVLTLGDSLACIIEEDRLFFKSFYSTRPILDLKERYEEATQREVMAFAQSSVFSAVSIEDFVGALDQFDRKRITEVQETGMLAGVTIERIQEVANMTDFPVIVRDQKLVLPTERHLVKAFLQFISDSRYRGLFSGTPFITNSRRPAPPLSQP